MPALSNHQSIIAAALQHAQQLHTQYYSCHSHLWLLCDEFSGSSSESVFSDSRSSGDSMDSTSTSSSADTSTSQVDDSYSSTTGSHLGDAELNWVLADLHYSYLRSLYCTQHFMCILLSTVVDSQSHQLYPELDPVAPVLRSLQIWTPGGLRNPKTPSNFF